MRVDRAVIIIGMAGLGIIMAYIIETMYSKGVLIDEYITGTIAIGDLLTFIVLAFLMGGVIWGATKR